MSYISEKYPDMYVVNSEAAGGSLRIVETLAEAEKIRGKAEFEGEFGVTISLAGKVLVSKEEAEYSAHCLEVAASEE